MRDAEALRQQLLHVPGVKKVNILGEQAERIYLSFSRYDRLATLGLSPEAIFAALNSQNSADRRRGYRDPGRADLYPPRRGVRPPAGRSATRRLLPGAER
ncbi:hypothetical protein LN650_13250 [Klebsiella pneumoniae subsp. pneumoniae]|nr:hypothetical protein [Klebsiella pneumoniae subsp. pneumoniae]